jgi:cell division ATPase FtsA
LPNEHLAGDPDDEINHPMYSTAVGLILKAYEQFERDGVEYGIAGTVADEFQKVNRKLKRKRTGSRAL